jgi:hypothetical protein
MSRDGSGTYSLPAGNPVTTGTTISSTWANDTMTDLAAALTASIVADGQKPYSANQPMGGYKHTGMGTGSAATDSANLGQVQAAAYQLLGGVSGVDTITASATPAISAYASGQTFRFVSAGANTGAVTININSLGAKSVTKNGATALAAGDIPSGALIEICYDGTRFQLTSANALSLGGGTMTGLLTLSGDPSAALHATPLRGIAGHISGLIQSNSAGDTANDVDISTGVCADSTGAYLMRLTSTLTKQLDASWAAGTNAGGLDTGAVGNNEYYIWLIRKDSDGTIDALFSLSSTAPTMPGGYTAKRLIGWVKRSGGTNLQFSCYEAAGGGLDFRYKEPIADVSLLNTLTTSRRTDALSVPKNFSVLALVRACWYDGSAIFQATLSCPDETDAAPSISASPGATVYSYPATSVEQREMFVRTSATGTVAGRAALTTVDTYYIITVGFEWSRR